MSAALRALLHRGARAASSRRLRHDRVVDPGRCPRPRASGSPASSNKPGPLPELSPSATATLNWQVNVGKAAPGLRAGDHPVRRSTPPPATARWCASIRPPDASSGASAPGASISAGPGADESLVRRRHRQGRGAGVRHRRQAGVDRQGVERGDRAAASSPTASAIVFSGDGRIFGLAAADGKTKWVNQRVESAADVRNDAGGVAARGGAVRRHAPAGACSRSTSRRATIGWDGDRRHPEGRDRARAHRRRHEPAAASTRRRCARSRTRAASPASTSRAARCCGRATCRASTGLAGDEPLPLRRPTTSGARARARQDDRRVGVEAGHARAAPHRRPAAGRRPRRRRRRRGLRAPASRDQRRVRRPPRHRRQPATASRCARRQRLRLSDGGTLQSVTAR